MMKSRRVGRPKTKLTEEQVAEIQKVNKEKLDYILSQGPEYIIDLAIKYYGEGWMQVFEGEEHYLRTERSRYNSKHGALIGSKTNRERRIHQINAETDEIIETWENVDAAGDAMDLGKTQRQTLVGVLRGRAQTYLGYKWQFADPPRIVIYGQDEANQ